MTTSRLAILLAVLLGGMGSVFLLPRQLGFQPVGINLELPATVGEWEGKDLEVSEKEHSTLGYDTEFARKLYENKKGGRILASIVLSGEDMMQGIHRPERCLNAQGWTVGDGSGRVIDIPNFGSLRTTRLENSRKVYESDHILSVTGICYYWFVGYTNIAASHGERVWIDSRDRVLKGYNQRWAMVMINADIITGSDQSRVDQVIENFIQQVTPKILKESVKPG